MKNDNDKSKKDHEKDKVKTEPEEKDPSASSGQGKEVEELKEKLEEIDNKYKRALADYQNLQKRVQEERLDWLRTANKELLLRLLPILDTLLLANQHVKNEGLQISINHFLEALKAEGVKQIETVGKVFNPELMEVIATGDGEEGKVIDEIRVGFMLHDKLLRPAQVRVGKRN